MEESQLPFVKLYSEPRKDEYSRSFPFRVAIEYEKDKTGESDIMKELQESVDRFGERVKSIPSGEFNAIFSQVTIEKIMRGKYTIVASYTLYHLNML